MKVKSQQKIKGNMKVAVRILKRKVLIIHRFFCPNCETFQCEIFFTRFVKSNYIPKS